MTKYQKAYYLLCSMTSKALDELPDIPANTSGRKMLQDALYEAEEFFLDGPDDEPEH